MIRHWRIYSDRTDLPGLTIQDRTTAQPWRLGRENSLQAGADRARKRHRRRPHLPAHVDSKIGIPSDPKFLSARTATRTRKTQMKTKKNRKMPQTSPKRAPPGMRLQF